MAKEIISDELWVVIEPLLPPPMLRPQGGRPPLPDRKVLTGIVFVPMTGVLWEVVLQEIAVGAE